MHGWRRRSWALLTDHLPRRDDCASVIGIAGNVELGIRNEPKDHGADLDLPSMMGFASTTSYDFGPTLLVSCPGEVTKASYGNTRRTVGVVEHWQQRATSIWPGHTLEISEPR